MPITREARHLSGNDIGKTVTATCTVDDRTVTGVLDQLTHYGTGATLTIRGGGSYLYVRCNDLVTIKGTPTPTGLDLHKSVLDQDR